MKIWLETNINAHGFIPGKYWQDNFALVKEQILCAEILIFQEDGISKGFIGIMDKNYIAGLFVAQEYQNQGIGSVLLKEMQNKYPALTLDVYVKNGKAVDFYEKHHFKILQEKFNEQTKALEYTMVWQR